MLFGSKQLLAIVKTGLASQKLCYFIGINKSWEQD